MWNQIPKVALQIWRDEASPMLRFKVLLMGIVLIAFNLGMLALLFFFSFSYSYYLSNGLLAYSLGLRHAVDADHIAAIDNVTRKLVGDGKQPVAVGLWFSLGHSTVVFSLGLALAFGSQAVSGSLGSLQEYGGIVGTCVSAGFLYLIGFINLIVLVGIYKSWRALRRGETITKQSLEEILKRKGCMSTVLSWVVARVDRSWKMYPLGLLFGLGFDTASEVALLGISVLAANNGFPAVLVILLPLLFVAGMSLLDTADGILMIWAYGWALMHPSRNLFYNMTITLAGVLIAFVIGTIEVLSLLSDSFHLTGWFWDIVNGINFETLGFVIVGLFVLSFFLSYVYYKWQRYDLIDAEVRAALIEEGTAEGGNTIDEENDENDKREKNENENEENSDDKNEREKEKEKETEGGRDGDVETGLLSKDRDSYGSFDRKDEQEREREAEREKERVRENEREKEEEEITVETKEEGLVN